MRLAAARAALAAVLACASLAAWSQSYRCTSKDGKKYYGSTIPQQCIGQPIEQLSAQGTVIRRFDSPAATEAERAAKEAEAARKREEDQLAKDAARRNRALLATYTSEKDIDEARGRALVENEKAIKAVEIRIADIKKRQATFDKEMEFYRDAAKPADKSGKAKAGDPKRTVAKPPPKLAEEIRNADVDLAAQESLLATKQKEVEAINAKYDEDKKRYLELTRPAKK
jgi:hypothetical protein